MLNGADLDQSTINKINVRKIVDNRTVLSKKKYVLQVTSCYSLRASIHPIFVIDESF